jgi:hypothetical protein
MWTLDGERLELVPRYVIVLADKCRWLTREQPLDDTYGLCQALDPAPAGVKADPELVVLGLHEPRAEAELEAAIGQQIDRRRFPRYQDRVAEIIVEDIGADAEMRRGFGSTHQRRQRRETVGQVIGHTQYRIAQRFELARFVHPGGP